LRRISTISSISFASRQESREGRRSQHFMPPIAQMNEIRYSSAK
jgi:hypothetical protein